MGSPSVEVSAMSRSFVQLGLVPVLAAALASAGTAFLMSMSAEGLPPERAESLALEPLRLELTRIEQDNMLLRRRLEDLENLAWTQPAVHDERADAPRPLVDENLLALQQKVDALTMALQDASVSSGDGPFVDSVEAAMQILREREEKQRDAERAQLVAERIDERIAELTAELGLDNWQQTQMRTLYNEASAERGKVFETARSSGDFGGMRDAMRAVDAATDSQLAGILSPGQLTSFQELGGMDLGFGFPGGGRRGFGGDRTPAPSGN